MERPPLNAPSAQAGNGDTARPLPFERDALLAQLGGDEAALRELLGLYLEEAPHLHEAVRAAVAQSDALLLRRSAHALKGTLLSLMAQEAGQAALALECMARAGAMTDAPAAWANLEQKLQHLHSELDRLLAERNQR